MKKHNFQEKKSFINMLSLLCAIFVVIEVVVFAQKHDFLNMSGNHEISIKKHSCSRLHN